MSKLPTHHQNQMDRFLAQFPGGEIMPCFGGKFSKYGVRFKPQGRIYVYYAETLKRLVDMLMAKETQRGDRDV